jgi:hypothetical protein
MTRDEYLKELNKAFGDFKFYEENHTYTYKDKPIEIGATGLIEQYTQDFDAQAVAERVAERDNKSVQEVLDEWKQKNEWACEKGHLGHCYAQETWEQLYPSPIWFDDEEKRIAINRICNQADNFYNDYKDRLELVYNEYVIGGYEYNLASAIDALFINKLTGGLILVDYKTNSDIHKNERYAKQMKVPLSHLKDSTINHYHIQLSIYKYLVEKYTNLKIEEMFIVWFSENNDNYQIIDVPYLEKEVKNILELRRANKMAKMLLVMGEPASGKTVSLRNIPKNELYYIDCDKKGLNYKGWKNDFNEEKKNYFKSNDGEKILQCMMAISEKREDIKYIAIDTINSIMIADEMRRSKDKNFDKWVDLASCIFNLINIVPDLRDDLTVIFIGHTQTDDEGFTRLLTNGKKLNKIGLEKYFDTVLIAKNNDGKYVFETTSPNSTARVPMGTYENQQYIENDLYEIIKELKEY